MMDKISGYSLSQGQIKNLYPIIAENDQALYKKYLKKLELGKESQFVGFLNTNRNQIPRKIEITSTPRFVEGNFSGSRDIIRIISTNQQKRQEEYMQMQKERIQILELQDKIRNPLHAIQGFTHLWKDDEINEDAHFFSKQILEACKVIQEYLTLKNSNTNSSEKIKTETKTIFLQPQRLQKKHGS